jgi:hypothetical protein
MSDQQEQYSNPGDWRKGRFITLVGQHLDISKMALAPQLRAAGVLCLRMQKETSRRTKADVTVSLLLGGYNISH